MWHSNSSGSVNFGDEVIFGGYDIVNNQRFNESHLCHMEQAIFVKSLID
jgi:hypothetical protein